MTRVRVIGAGLSGLAAAWALTRHGRGVEIIDPAPRAGGLIQTVHLPDGPCETGANGFVWSPAVERLFAELRIEPQFAREASRKRYLFRDGKPRRWPLTPLETAAAAGRYGAAKVFGAATPRMDETVAAWGDRVLGGAATAWLLSPAFQGIYGAPASELSAAAIGIGKPRRKIRLGAPRAGMGAVIDALTAGLRARGAVFRLGERAQALEAGAPAIVCTSAAAAVPLVAPHHHGFAAAAARIRSVPLVSVTAFFEPRPADLRAFGVLFPRGSARALGVLFNTEIFEHRGALRSERWIYGDAGLIDAPADAVEAAVLGDRRLLSPAADPLVNVHVKGWRAALPVYDQAVLESTAAAASLPPWLGVCGNYLGRIGVSALIERAEAEAARIAGGAA